MSRLIARESSAISDRNAAAGPARVVARIAGDLSRYIGIDGCRALLLRALSDAQGIHPPLKNINISAQPDLSVQGVAEGIQAHGAAAVGAGLESTLVGLIELLGRLIGDELAMKLVEQDPSAGASPDDEPDQAGG